MSEVELRNLLVANEAALDAVCGLYETLAIYGHLPKHCLDADAALIKRAKKKLAKCKQAHQNEKE